MSDQLGQTPDLSADAVVDALAAGDADARSRMASCADRTRMGDLLVVHGLLGQLASSEALRRDAGIRAAIDQIHRDASRTFVFRRRFVPMAAAAALAIAAWGTWYVVSAENRAVAELIECHHKHGPRRYTLDVQRIADSPEMSELRGTVDVDGDGHYFIELPVPAPPPLGPMTVRYGRGPDGYWVITPDGTLRESRSSSVIRDWVTEIAGDSPLPNVDSTIERLADDYDVSVNAEAGALHYQAKLTAADPTAATDVEIRFNRGSMKIQRIAWTWSAPAGSVSKVKSVTAELVEPRVFEAGWFGPKLHLDRPNGTSFRMGPDGAPEAIFPSAPRASGGGSAHSS